MHFAHTVLRQKEAKYKSASCYISVIWKPQTDELSKDDELKTQVSHWGKTRRNATLVWQEFMLKMHILL